LLEAVISGIALTDPDKAFALAAAAPPAQRLEALQGAVGYRSDRDAAAMADRIARSRSGLARVCANDVGVWVGVQKPQEALDWLQRNGQSLPADVYHDIGRQLARNDPAAAASYLTQIPSAARPGWIAPWRRGWRRTICARGSAGSINSAASPGTPKASLRWAGVGARGPGRAAALLATVGAQCARPRRPRVPCR